MKNDDTIEKETERKYGRLDRKKRKKMGVSGKNVFLLQKLIDERREKRVKKIKYDFKIKRHRRRKNGKKSDTGR